MLEILTLAAALLVARRALRRATRESKCPAPAAKPLVPTRPPHVDHHLFTRHRGAVCTTQELAARYLAADPGPLYLLAGVLWPARRFLNKLTLITGKPDSGKTAMMRMMMQSVAGLFHVLPEQSRAGLYPGEGKMRWLVVDPTDAYFRLLYQVVPSDVPIVRATPMDAGGRRWAIRDDITSAGLNRALQAGLFPDSLARKAGDPFWNTKAREVTEGVVDVFLEKGSAWEFHDLIIPIKYPQFLKPLLEQGITTRGLARHELVGRLGRDIISTASSITNSMAIAAALWQRAEATFSLRDFLDARQVLHFAYTPVLIPSLAGIANALTHILVLVGTARDDPFDHTVLWLDEGRYLADLAGLEDLAARGRGAGFGAIFAAQGTPGLVNKWGKARVDELVDLVSTWVALTAGPDTAEAFSKAVGKVEGLLKSYSLSFTSATSETRGTSDTSSWGPGFSSTRGHGSSHSVTTSHSSTYAESFQLTVRDAVLPSELTNLPYADPVSDRIHGYAFNPETGAFYFESPFVSHFRDLPDPPVDAMPLRPDSAQRLMPWRLEDVGRLKLEATPELIAAIEMTWDEMGGVK
ncbi:MAG: hypothetical protein KatS3mg108_2621 [Isosphaeraceae bacterium]|jgi:hypothetical protein|nr:MAG: hypothetical protein KatS3mg108_2621 [Isosphaeraceae bacterium]